MAAPESAIIGITVRDMATGRLRTVALASEELDRALQGLQGASTRTTQGLRTMGRVIGTVNMLIAQASIMVFVLGIVTRGLAHAQERVISAQERYIEVLERYGAGSRQARRALRRLHLAHQDLNIAQMQAYFQYFMLIGVVFTFVQHLMMLHQWLQTIQGAYYGVAIARAIAFPVAGAIGIAAGLAIGAIIMNVQAQTGAQVEEAFREVGRRARRRYEERMGAGL